MKNIDVVQTIDLDHLRELTSTNSEGESSKIPSKKRKFVVPDISDDDEEEEIVTEVMKKWLAKLKSKEDRPKSKTKRKANETKTERRPDDLKFGEFDGVEDENYIQSTETCKNNEQQPEEGLLVADQSKSKDKSKTNDIETKKWTNAETCHLIELLEENPCLWDLYDKNYHMRDKRN